MSVSLARPAMVGGCMYSSGALSLTSAERIIPVPNRMRCLLGGAVAAGLLVGCGGDSTAPKPRIGLRIVTGADVSDTIGAVLTQALVVEVRESGGALAHGAVVRFTALPNDSIRYADAIEVAALNSQYFSGFVSDSTDTHGSAAVLVELGGLAGKAGIAITVPELGLTDTAWYTVEPGRPAQFALGVRDTVVMKGIAWDIGSRVMDRAGNPLSSDSVSYTSLNSGATVTKAGHVTAVSEGRAEIVVQYGTAHDTSRASIVPAGMVAAARPYDGVYLMNLDGSGLKKLTGISDYSVYPQWSPDGKRITIYEGNPYGTVSFTALSLDGTRTPVIPTPGSLLGGVAWARPDMSGLLYFAGPRSDNGAMGVWRMKADGTEVVELGTPTDTYDFTHPEPSPDGKTVLYDVDPQGIMALDVTSGTKHALGLQGYFPSYSPDGAHIAFVTGSSLMVANSDGTNARSLSGTSGSDQLTAPTWSADGKWILAPRPGQADALVRVSDGLVLPLPFAAAYSQLSLH
jgi:WD40-like Beta Propeller Repeat